MQKTALFALMLALFAILFGCAGPPEPAGSAGEPSKDADPVAPQAARTPEEIGPGPLPENYPEMILDYLQNNLIDPDSIRDLEIGKPEIKISERAMPENERGTKVWQVPVWFDAKSQSGKYTGRQLSHAEFKDGQIITFY